MMMLPGHVSLLKATISPSGEGGGVGQKGLINHQDNFVCTVQDTKYIEVCNIRFAGVLSML
jgi:hypothetical protein